LQSRVSQLIADPHISARTAWNRTAVGETIRAN